MRLSLEWPARADSSSTTPLKRIRVHQMAWHLMGATFSGFSSGVERRSARGSGDDGRGHSRTARGAHYTLPAAAARSA